LLALTGDFNRGRELALQGREELRELGLKVQYAGIGMPAAMIELLDGDPAAAEVILQEASEILAPAGERGYLSTVYGLLGLAMAKQGRYDDADRLADESRATGAEDDAITQIYWRVDKAHVAAGRGDAETAREVAIEVLELAGDYGSFDGAYAILEIAGYLEPGTVRGALELALSGARAKGNVVTEAEALAALEALPSPSR
jgi:hypothetical protein